ncbi:MAG: prepilin peptidase [Bryobacteraceae bacterium]
MIPALLAGLAGLLIGSFLNVCIYRLPRDLSVVRPRSFCPACEGTVLWYDNIPVLSFLLLRGRCRRCGEGIGWRYPLVELATAVAFYVAVSALGVTPAALKLCVFSAIMIALIATDLEERILPDEFTLGGAAAGVIFSVFVFLPTGLIGFLLPVGVGTRWRSAAESIFAAAFASGFFWLVRVLYEKVRHREGLALGDVKMAALIGAFLGLEETLLTLGVGSILGIVCGGPYIFFTRKKASTYGLPFGTFLGIAALSVAAFGGAVAAWLA